MPITVVYGFDMGANFMGIDAVLIFDSSVDVVIELLHIFGRLALASNILEPVEENGFVETLQTGYVLNKASGAAGVKVPPNLAMLKG